MSDHITDEQLDALLNGLTEAARKVRKERYGKNVAVKPRIIDLLVRIARIHQGELSSTWLHQYADELEAECAAHQTTKAELDECTQMLVRIEPKIDQITQRVTVQQAELEAAQYLIEQVRSIAPVMFEPELDAYDAARAREGGRGSM